MISEKPVYNLKVVLKETGIKADVLRAWERRYGLPMPQRSPGGHRLYSQRDIATIKWLIARQNEGLSISHAVELWKEQVNRHQDPLSIPETLDLVKLPSETSIDKVRKEWINACRNFNEPIAEQVINQAFSLFPVEMVVTRVIQSGIREIGEMWYEGDISVQQEHFTSALALRRLETLIAATPPPSRLNTIILACPAEEWHTFSLVVLHLFLRRKGYPVVFLGANVPVENLIDSVKNIRPALVILASQQLTSASNLQKSAIALSQDDIQVAFGGRIFNTIPEIRSRIPGHFLGTTVDDSLLKIDQLIEAPQLNPKIKEISPEYIQLTKEFIEKRNLIEAGTLEEIRSQGLSNEYLTNANYFLGNELVSALELGNVDYLTADMTWLKGLLSRHQVSSKHLVPYLLAYGNSLQKAMNGHSIIFMKWMNSITNED